MAVAVRGADGSELSRSGGAAPDLQLLNISKSFGTRQVLDDVSIEVRRGEVVGLLGHNGSGKSTFLNIASGVMRADSGSTKIGGRAVDFHSVAQARQAGVVLMSQTGALFPELSVLENIFAGSERTSRILGVRFLRARDMRMEVLGLYERLGLDALPLDAPVSTLSQGQRFLVGFIRVFRLQPVMLALDEPTAALGYRERTAVNTVIGELAASGCGVILVSHILEDVLALAHHVVVLQRGRVVYCASARDADRATIIEALVS